jgi:hypothetical protein
MLTFVVLAGLIGLLGVLFVGGAAVWSGPVGFGWPAPRPLLARVWRRWHLFHQPMRHR